MKCLHTRTFCEEQVGDGVGSRVANAQPDHLRGLPPNETELTEVVVLGDQGEAVAGSVLPERKVGLALELDEVDVLAVWVENCEPSNEATAEVLVEQ